MNPVTIRALPGAEWRTTKYESTGVPGRMLPAWKPPTGPGLYAAFARACQNPIPGPDDVDRLPTTPAKAKARRPATADASAAHALRVIAQLVADFDAYNARQHGYRYKDTPAVSEARALLRKDGAA